MLWNLEVFFFWDVITYICLTLTTEESLHIILFLFVFFLITYLTAYLTVLWWESVEFFLDHLFRANVNQKVSS